MSRKNRIAEKVFRSKKLSGEHGGISASVRAVVAKGWGTTSHLLKELAVHVARPQSEMMTAEA